MSIMVILTLVMAFVITCFGIFNTEVTSINLFGIKTVTLPLSFLCFFIFMSGAVFSGILCFQKQVEQALTIRKLKRRVQEYKDVIEEQEAAGSSAGAEEAQEPAQEETPEPPPAPAPKRRNSFFPVVNRKSRNEAPAEHSRRREAVPPQRAKASDETAESARNDDEEPDELSAAEGEDEAGLSARLKEIALRRIRNG